MEDFNAKIRNDCWNYSVDASGIAHLYEGKINKLSRLSKFSKVMGVLVPVSLGGIVASYSLDSAVVSWAIKFCAALGVIQLIFSTWLIVSDGEANLVLYTEIWTEYKILASDFLQLGKYPPEAFAELEKRFIALSEREKGISKKVMLTPKEERKGLRYGLRLHERACVKCKQVPYDLDPTDCPVCGNF